MSECERRVIFFSPSKAGQVETRNVWQESRSRLAHLLLRHFLRILERLVDRRDDEILEHLGIVGIDHFLLDLNLRELLPSVRGDLDHPSPGFGDDALPLEFGLYPRRLVPASPDQIERRRTVIAKDGG